MFYQTFWEVVKDDLLAMFNEWYNDKLDLYRLNFVMITLIPKENEARYMKKFRPISLLNCSFKIFTKVLTNRLARIIIINPPSLEGDIYWRVLSLLMRSSMKYIGKTIKV
jgi:hypothetical protein